jgi:hypothetical protein
VGAAARAAHAGVAVFGAAFASWIRADAHRHFGGLARDTLDTLAAVIGGPEPLSG